MKKPYEFLIRWDPLTGEVKGAHVGFANVFVEDGVAQLGQIDPVVPVAVGTQQGFPLAAILKEINVSALAKVDQLKDEIKATQDDANARIGAMADAHAAEVQALQAKASVSPDAA